MTGRPSSATACGCPACRPSANRTSSVSWRRSSRTSIARRWHGGASEHDADAHACRQIGDWEQPDAATSGWRNGHTRGPGWSAWPTASKWPQSRQTRRSVPDAGRCPARRALRRPPTDQESRRSRSWPSSPWRSASAPPARCSASSTACCCARCRIPEPDSLVRVNEIVPQYGRFSVAPATFFDWRMQNTSFERIVAAQSGVGHASPAANGAERINNALVSWDFFEMARVHPVMGRAFTAEEDVPGQEQRGRPQPRHVAAAVRRRPRHRRPRDRRSTARRRRSSA